jgi:hypothetical protein
MIEKEKIIETVAIICSSENVVTEIKKSLLESGIDIMPLQNTTIIAVENTLNGARMQDFSGIDIAHKMLINEPSKKIILYHVTPIEFLRKRNQKLDIILAKPNIRLLEMPFPIETMINAFELKSIEIDSEDTKNALNEHIRGQISGIWHDIKKAPNPLNPEQGWQAEMVAKGIQKAKELFPMLDDKDNAFILKFLEEISAIREEIRKGENLTGIFCDMEGTLFTNSTLNKTLLNFLHKQENDGKKIILWTDGNLSELQSLLDANNITYQLEAKRDFAGAIVEMAIDDMDEHSFTATTKIYAKKFTRAQDIPA